MNLPNKLTVIRILAIPFFVASFYIPGAYSFWIPALIFVGAFITDVADGKIARERNLVTDFGKFMDPIADKLLAAAALIMLSSTQALTPIVTIIIISREFIVSGLRIVVAGDGIVVPANWLGKAKTVSQFVMLLLLLIAPVVEFVFNGFGRGLTNVVIVASTLLTIWSGIVYVVSYWPHIDYRK